MPREYGKAWFSMFTDDHFTSQLNIDKFLYMTLLGQPSLNYAGVTPINFKRWRKAIREGDRMPSELEAKAALIRLERNDYVFTDDDTGEVLVRSFMRRDEVHKMPNVMLSALRAAAQVESPKLARVLAAELTRVDLPVINGVSDGTKRLRLNLERAHRDAVAHLGTLAESAVEPFSEPFSEDFPEGLPEPFSEDFPEGLPEPFSEGFSRPGETEPFTEGFPEGFGEGSVVVEVEVEVAKSPTADGYVGGRVRARPSTRTEPPPAHCSKHPEGTDAPCRACGDARQARTAWDAEQKRLTARAQSDEVRQRAEDRAQAIADCDICDEDGYDRLTLCDHDPDTAERAKRGIALIRETLPKRAAQ
ncbi:hypothetical protein JOJ86_005910 [Rhodococcus percolatus]|uniref:hypothetical protein n=1 Tax=Rhodococcus opacus TaxID=37919 RepID=UPI001AE85352|nr:hypothetical protein [Rhodococcus opacus]MBP2208184.1 hypothetical protein [Rhodococcus opacus]